MAKDKKVKSDKGEKSSKKTAKVKGQTYNLNDFASPIAEEREVEAGVVKGVLASFFELINSTVTDNTLKPGDSVNMPGLGKLVCQLKKARKARNPRTGETFMTDARPAVKFKLASQLRIWGKPVKKVEKKVEKKKSKK